MSSLEATLRQLWDTVFNNSVSTAKTDRVNRSRGSRAGALNRSMSPLTWAPPLLRVPQKWLTLTTAQDFQVRLVWVRRARVRWSQKAKNAKSSVTCTRCSHWCFANWLFCSQPLLWNLEENLPASAVHKHLRRRLYSRIAFAILSLVCSNLCNLGLTHLAPSKPPRVVNRPELLSLALSAVSHSQSQLACMER